MFGYISILNTTITSPWCLGQGSPKSTCSTPRDNFRRYTAKLSTPRKVIGWFNKNPCPWGKLVNRLTKPLDSMQRRIQSTRQTWSRCKRDSVERNLPIYRFPRDPVNEREHLFAQSIQTRILRPTIFFSRRRRRTRRSPVCGERSNGSAIAVTRAVASVNHLINIRDLASFVVSHVSLPTSGACHGHVPHPVEVSPIKVTLFSRKATSEFQPSVSYSPFGVISSFFFFFFFLFSSARFLDVEPGGISPRNWHQVARALHGPVVYMAHGVPGFKSHLPHYGRLSAKVLSDRYSIMSNFGPAYITGRTVEGQPFARYASFRCVVASRTRLSSMEEDHLLEIIGTILRLGDTRTANPILSPFALYLYES